MQPSSVYDAIGGEETFRRLVAGFYARVRDDDILAPMYPAEDFDGAAQRLQWFLAQYWGGPAEFNANRGAPRLRMRHVAFPIDSAAAQRWLDLMGASLDDIEEETIPPAYRAMIWDHMQRVAVMLINRPD